MSVENFWCNLKHETLHHFVHPCLGQLIYLIAVEVLPYTEAKMQIFEADFRPGCAKALTPYRKAFKKCWKMLAVRPLGTQVYMTDLATWTCSCRQQKYNAFLLCKHLVQAFDARVIMHWRERRTISLKGHVFVCWADKFKCQ
jgi:hypothetical protein